MGRKRNKFNASAYQNNRTFMNIYNRLKSLAINAYEWENLPDTVDERFLEKTLYEMGYCLFFKDEELDRFLVSECGIGSPNSFYQVPTLYHAYAVNGYQKEYDINNAVLIWNDYERLPTAPVIWDFAIRLYEIQRTMDVNVKSMKYPIYIEGTEDDKLALKNLAMEYDGSQYPIAIMKGKNPNKTGQMGVINLETPYNIDKLSTYYHEIWNQALTYIGIQTVDIQKKERLTQRESESQQGIVDMQRNIKLNARRQACQKIKKIYNLPDDMEIRVKFRYGQDELEDLIQDLMKEREENGKVYNNNQELSNQQTDD